MPSVREGCSPPSSSSSCTNASFKPTGEFCRCRGNGSDEIPRRARWGGRGESRSPRRSSLLWVVERFLRRPPRSCPEKADPAWNGACTRGDMGLRSFLFAVVPLTLVAGCADSSRVTPLRSPPHALASRPREAVEVFTVKPPDRPFTELAIISSIDGLNGVSERAGQLGCDAGFLLAPGSGPRTAWGYRRSTTRATCLVYDQPWNGRGLDPRMR